MSVRVQGIGFPILGFRLSDIRVEGLEFRGNFLGSLS